MFTFVFSKGNLCFDNTCLCFGQLGVQIVVSLLRFPQCQAGFFHRQFVVSAVNFKQYVAFTDLLVILHGNADHFTRHSGCHSHNRTLHHGMRCHGNIEIGNKYVSTNGNEQH